MKRFLTLKSCLLTIFAVALIVGLGLRSYWQVTRPDWVYWSGDMVLGLLILSVGFSLSVAMIVRPQFAIKLGSRGNKRREVTFIELAMWFSVGLAMMLLGTISVLSTLSHILSHCPAPAC